MDVQLQTCKHQILIKEYFLFGFAHLGRWHLESCQVWCFAFSFNLWFSLAPSLFRNVTEEISGWSQFGNYGHPGCEFGPLEQIQRLWPPDLCGMPRSSKMELEDSPKCCMDVENSRYDICIPSCSLQSQKVKGALHVKDLSKLQDQSLSILRHWLVWQMRSSSSNTWGKLLLKRNWQSILLYLSCIWKQWSQIAIPKYVRTLFAISRVSWPWMEVYLANCFLAGTPMQVMQPVHCRYKKKHVFLCFLCFRVLGIC